MVFAMVLVIGVGAVQAAEMPGSDPASAAAAERGKPLYAQYCASCHDQPTGCSIERSASIA